jgi:hypothetical protein
MLISSFRVHGAVSSWHIAAFAAPQHQGRYWTNNRQKAAMAFIGYAANDPKRIFNRGPNDDAAIKFGL